MKKAVLTVVFLSMLLMLTLTAIPVGATPGNPDVNTDGRVDIVDIALILRAFGTTPAAGGTPGNWGAWNHLRHNRTYSRPVRQQSRHS